MDVLAAEGTCIGVRGRGAPGEETYHVASYFMPCALIPAVGYKGFLPAQGWVCCSQKGVDFSKI